LIPHERILEVGALARGDDRTVPVVYFMLNDIMTTMYVL
jgi:hypothetical protein